MFSGNVQNGFLPLMFQSFQTLLKSYGEGAICALAYASVGSLHI